ncbi:unnamed protein product [Owenia fusiformis]|uniref:Uncharacterized protein n=1 Tax=Owenia fusiformis TaxID=6347 RepID=A0A8J1U8L1_OWEFU|nr:unnamed protein product [Owenia fusiformis]
MKFGNTLLRLSENDSKYGHQYMQYKLLKMHVKEQKGNNDPQKEVEFVRMLESELQRIKKLISAKIDELKSAGQGLQMSVKMADISNEIPDLQRLGNQADVLATDMAEIERFVFYNKEGFRKIVKKHDKVTGTRSFWFEAQKHAEFFSDLAHELEGILIQLSDIYEYIREKQGGNKVSAEHKVSQETFERKSTKYWIAMEDAFLLKTMLVKHMPLYIFSRTKQEDNKRMANKRTSILLQDHGKKFEEFKFLQKSGWISSVYFDSTDLHSYHRRVAMKEGATLIRIRWYGDPDESSVAGDMYLPRPPAKGLFCERKTHHECWVAEDSLKERFPIKKNNITDFITGKKPAAECCLSSGDSAMSLAEEIQKEILDNKLVPMVRTVYKRSAFQLEETNDVRITLDQALSFVNEHPSVRDDATWHRDETELENNEDWISFHAAVLEVKLKTASPEWLEELLKSPIIRMVNKFSKFQQSCTSYNADKVKIWPYWFEDDEIKEAKKRTKKIRQAKDEDEGIVREENKEQTLRKPTPSFGLEPDYAYDNKAYGDDALGDIEMGMFEKKAPSVNDVPGGTIGTFVSTVNDNPPGIKTIDMTEHSLKNGTSAYSNGGTAITKQRKRLASENKPEAVYNDNDDNTNCFGKPQKFKKATKRLKIEPKTYFANERTFMQWSTAALFLIGIGGTLVGTQSEVARVVTIVFFALALFMVLYACVVFYVRMVLIKRGTSGRFDDWFGPALLTCLLITGLGFSFYAFHYSWTMLPLTVIPIQYWESPVCVKLQLKNNPVFFSPSGLSTNDPERRLAWTCADNRIAQLDLDTGEFLQVHTIGDEGVKDFECVTFAKDADVIWIGSEEPENEIIEYNIKTKRRLRTLSMEPVSGKSTKLMEGLAFMDFYYPLQDLPQKVVGNGTFFTPRPQSLGSFYIPVGFGGVSPRSKIKVPADLTTEKIGAMTTLGDTLYTVFDNAHVLVGYDMFTAKMTRYQIPGNEKNWEGILFRPHSSGMWVYLAKDNPPEIWRFDFDTNSGFKGC